MTNFQISSPVYLHINGYLNTDKCYGYAINEITRLLARGDVQYSVIKTLPTSDIRTVQITSDTRLPDYETPELDNMAWDGYHISVTGNSIILSARSAKGILNSVYDIAERMGVLFLLPGEDGEWMPEDGLKAIPVGEYEMNPRFPYRGVFWEPLDTKDYSVEEWLRFYAKLRFNSLSNEITNRELCQQLGIRLEIGGHGLSNLLPRELFDKNPEYFRLAQPEDFCGKRVNDSNLCVTNPTAKQIVQENYRQLLVKADGAYAIHAWADDLPAGGWCHCPSCRSLTPEDQSMLAMRMLAKVVQNTETPFKVPVIAYHDTLFPGEMIPPLPEMFLLFAPRERCYGHALDDQTCPRNKHYLQALQAWIKLFDGIDDAHTFEYYFDQILFRGMYPYLPDTILSDMAVYADNGIESHMSLQVAGPTIAPEYNMLLFARAHWDSELTAIEFAGYLAARISPSLTNPWERYINKRGVIFQSVCRMCDYTTSNMLDYRWLPENNLPFGTEMATCYARAAQELAFEADMLANAISPLLPERMKILIGKEVGRARFEATELQVMAHQQQAMNGIGHYFTTDDQQSLTDGVRALEMAVKMLQNARIRAEEANIPVSSWYYNNINGWLEKEFKSKISLFGADNK
jgi:hypothetical protein